MIRFPRRVFAVWFALCTFAAAAEVRADTPPIESWAQTRSDIPADPAVRFGVLPNGMRYAIMRNATPKGEVSLRFRIAAGALTESDAQQGMAHMVEHMTFRGTTHVPQSEEWKGLQRLGLAMGADVSAFTSDTQTFFQFDLPSADANSVDTGLMRMRETASEVLMRPDALEAERGTILSEERTRDTPGLRTSRAELAFFYKGQPIATHLPIGTLDNIEHTPASTLLDFYHAFYRPERATLIVVGDIDPDEIEAKIKARFADWRGVGPAAVTAPLGPVLQRGAEANLVVDPALSRAVVVGWISPYDDSPVMTERVRRRVVEGIGMAILNRRFQRAASKPDRPFIGAQVSRQSQARSARTTLLTVDIDPAHWRSALTAADVIRRQALQFGVRQDEVDRQIASALADYQTAADGAATRPTHVLAGGLLGAADNDTVFASPAEMLTLVKQTTDGLTAAQVTDALKSQFAGAGPLVFISSPIPIDGGEATVASAFHDAETQDISAPSVDAAPVWPHASFGPSGQVAEQHTIDDLGVTVVRFANGVRLTVKPTTFSADQVVVQVKIDGGRLDLPTNRGTAHWAADAGAYLLGGLKDLSYEDMQQALAGKVYGVGFGTRDDGFYLTGATTPGDLDTQLQVLVAYVTAPGWRPETYDRVKASASPQLNNLAASPGGVGQRDLGMLLHSGDPRWATLTGLDLTYTRAKDVADLLSGPLANGSIEVTVVGATSVDRAVAAVAATFGALPARPDPAPPAADALKVRFPDPTTTPVLRHHKGRADQALAVIAWPAPDFYSDPQRSRDMRIMEQIMQVRLFDQLRIGEGAAYVPETELETSTVFPGYGYIYAAAEVPPDKIDLFYAIATRIAADLRDKTVSADELDRAKTPRVDLFTRSQQTNAYWLTVLGGAAADPRKFDVIRTTIPDLRHVTAVDVRRAARAVLADDRAWRLEVLPPTPTPPKPDQMGSVTVNCAVGETSLSDCRVVRETPPGYGLGAEASALVQKLTLDAKTTVGKSGRIEFPVKVPLPDPTN